MFAARRWLVPSTRLAARQVHSTAAVSFPRRGGRDQDSSKPNDSEEFDYDMDDLPDFEEDDATSAAHVIIHQQRQILNYMRLIERDGPRLKSTRCNFDWNTS